MNIEGGQVLTENMAFVSHLHTLKSKGACPWNGYIIKRSLQKRMHFTSTFLSALGVQTLLPSPIVQRVHLDRALWTGSKDVVFGAASSLHPWGFEGLRHGRPPIVWREAAGWSPAWDPSDPTLRKRNCPGHRGQPRYPAR